MYVCLRTEPSLWTAGFYRPDGTFEPDSDHDSPVEATRRVSYLNGNQAAARPPLHVRITTTDQGTQLVADIPDWPYPIPAVGDYIFHPGLALADQSNVMIAGHVKTVGWRMYDRPAAGHGAFVPTAHPYVEIHI